MISNSDQAAQRRKTVLIMGCGRLGALIATSLVEQGCKVHILDPAAETFQRLPEIMIREGSIEPVIGDGTRQADLRKASIRDADVFVAVSGRDTRNALTAQTALHIFEIPNVICRMNDLTRKEMYDDLGITAVSGIRLVADMMIAGARR